MPVIVAESPTFLSVVFLTQTFNQILLAKIKIGCILGSEISRVGDTVIAYYDSYLPTHKSTLS